MNFMTIELSIESAIYCDYLRYLFPADDRNGSVLKVNGSTTFGQLLIASVRESPLPVAHLTGDHVVTLRLPKQDATQDLENKFIYYSTADQKRLNLALKAIFSMDFHDYYRRGESTGFAKKDIIEAFIVSRKLANADPTEALHKRVYREQAKRCQQLTKYLLRKAYYIEESLDTSKLGT